jgi:purine-binding chemotaxis protein CheW
MDQESARIDTQFVMLGIDREVFAVPVETVLEILDMRELFRVPDAPAYLSGLLDVRGRGVPVIDLRVKLGLGSAAVTEATRIMVLEVPLAGRDLVLGLMDDGRLEPAPDIGTKWRSDYILGVGRRGEHFVVVFDLGRLFASDEQAFLGAAEPIERAAA